MSVLVPLSADGSRRPTKLAAVVAMTIAGSTGLLASASQAADAATGAAATPAAATSRPNPGTFDTDANRDGVADCWFVNPWGNLSHSAWQGPGRSGRSQVIAAWNTRSGSSLRLAQEGRCTTTVSGADRVAAATWYWASGPAEMWIEARSAQGSWTRVTRHVLPRASSWTAFRPSATTMPAGAVAARIQFRLTGAGRLGVDDLTVTRLAAATKPAPAPAPTTPNKPVTPNTPVMPSAPAGTLFAGVFPLRNGLITNEYAYWNPRVMNAARSADWRVTSGSLFSRDGTAWSGVPDNREPNAASTNGTNSAIFRAITPVLPNADAAVSTSLRINRMTQTASTPQVAWDGIHVFLRYQNQYSLYYASVARRDGRVVLKKKCVGGSSNGGTYYTLGERGGYPLPLGTWAKVGASVKNNADGSVTLTLQRNGTTVLSAVDRGVGCSPIRAAGSTGVRGDNSDFQFTDFVATAN